MQIPALWKLLFGKQEGNFGDSDDMFLKEIVGNWWEQESGVTGRCLHNMHLTQVELAHHTLWVDFGSANKDRSLAKLEKSLGAGYNVELDPRSFRRAWGTHVTGRDANATLWDKACDHTIHITKKEE